MGIAASPSSTAMKTIALQGIAASALDAINGGAINIYAIEIDCTLNSGEDVYFKAKEAATATPGTDDPNLLLKGYKGLKKTFMFQKVRTFTNLSCWCVTGKGQASVTPPTGTVNVTIICT